MSETEEEEPERDFTPRAVKRMKLKLGTQPSPPGRMVVRLKLPPKSKGKEREEEELPRKDMFEDLLSNEDRDTSGTMVEASDKARYDKSRTQAEVSRPPPAVQELHLANSYRQNYSHPTPHHNPTREHRRSHLQDSSADQHKPSSLHKLNHPHHGPSTPRCHPHRILIHNHLSPFRLLLHLQVLRRCEYERSDLASTIFKLGMMLRFQKSTPICQMEDCGYASSASST